MATERLAEKRRATKLAEVTTERDWALDILLYLFKDDFQLYVTAFRKRFGCDPDTDDVPLGFDPRDDEEELE